MRRPTHRDVARHGLGAYGMAVESTSDNPFAAWFGNLSWISPLAGVEQLIGAYTGVEHHSYAVGSVALFLGPVFYLFGGGPWLRARLANLPRFKLVRVRKPTANGDTESFAVKDPPQYRELIADREFLNEVVE